MDNRVDDPITAGNVGETGHRSSAPADFAKGPFNRIGRSDPPPIERGHGVEGEEGFPVAQETGHRLRRGALPGLDPVAQRALGRMAIGRQIDAAGQVQTGVPVADPQVRRDIAEDMDPAGLAGDVGIDERQRRMEAAMAISGDQPQGSAEQAAAREGREERLPGVLAFLADDAVVHEFPRSGEADPVGDEDHAALGAIGGFHAEADRIEEEIPVVIEQRAPVEGPDGLVEGPRDGRDGGGADDVVEEAGEHRADLAGAQAAQEDSADEGVHGVGAPLVAVQDGGREAAPAGTGNQQIGDSAPGGGEAPHIRTIAVASSAAIITDIPAGVEGVGELLLHAILQEQLHCA